ncbi:hypothetical protein [Bacillus sp. J37]|nr:hypothetical protein [Bacillus sp. J37]
MSEVLVHIYLTDTTWLGVMSGTVLMKL